MEDLFTLISRCITLQEYTEAIADALNNPLWIMDQSYHILACSHHPDATPFRSAFFKSHSLLDHVASWQQAGILDQVSASPTPIHLYDPDFQKNLVIMDILVRNQPIGRLTVFLDHPVKDEDIIQCSQGAAIYLRSSHMMRNHGPVEQLFSTMLDGEKVNPDTVVTMLKNAGIPHSSSWRILCMSTDESIDHFPDILRSDLDQLKPSWITLIKGKHLYALVPGDDAVNEMDENVRTGISFPFDQFNDTQSCGKQAAFALSKGKERITYFADVITDYIPEVLSSSISLSTLILPSIRNLIAYDREYDTDYFETLKTYYENNESKAAASRVMMVHLNTIKYRLQQITSVFGIDLKKDAVNIRISLMILAYMDRNNMERKPA